MPDFGIILDSTRGPYVMLGMELRMASWPVLGMASPCKTSTFLSCAISFIPFIAF